MKKLTLTLTLLIGFFIPVKAVHIIGGEMYYQTVAIVSPTEMKYRVTLILFRDEYCVNCADLPTNVGIGVFNDDNNQLVNTYLSISATRTEFLTPTSFPPCVTNPPNLRYRAGYYEFDIVLPINTNGYTVAFQTCCRILGLTNITGNAGATYQVKIPGRNKLPEGTYDNSPRFSKKIDIVCYESYFELDFGATDMDGDSLVYSMCGALGGGMASDASYATPSPPPYRSLAYSTGFSGAQPLGPRATINPQTGKISGIAPRAGRYVVSVCVDSYRNGEFLYTHIKDFVLIVAPCDRAGATLPEVITNCKSYTVEFSNLNNSPLNQTYLWDFGIEGSNLDISTEESPSFTYPDTGVYTVKLYVNKGLDCEDSTSAIVKVYPGFNVDFTSTTPSCKNLPVRFTDATTAAYGSVNSWSWEFGDPSTSSDVSTAQNPTYTYTQERSYMVRLIAGSTKGCIDTIHKEIQIVDKPFFKIEGDTFLCSLDQMQLTTTTAVQGTVTWSPNYNISNINDPNPTVWPKVTTTYVAHFRDINGCETTDSIRIKVIDSVTMVLPVDTSICLTDAFQMPLQSDGRDFVWTPATYLDDPNIKQPIATPEQNITYQVQGSLGSCITNKTIHVNVFPYPPAYAGEDVMICYGDNTTLTATGGDRYQWSPTAFLSSPNQAQTQVIAPTRTLNYVVEVRYNTGCTKPTYDTVKVEVVKIVADAGPYDTAIVLRQDLQLRGRGGEFYEWTPSTGLNNPNISNPIASGLTSDINYILKASNSVGCFDYDTIRVKVFHMAPGVYVPDAFTPDGDGLNDVIRPIPLGIRSIERFSVYNRWGQLLFTEKRSNQGWNGMFKGKLQDHGTYIYEVEAILYTGRKFIKKGSFVLIQ